MTWNYTITPQTQKDVDDFERDDPEFFTNQVKRTIAMAKAHLPLMTSNEIDLLLRTVNGIILPPVESIPLDYLPQMLADMISAEFVEAAGNDPLRLEMEDGALDPDWLRLYGKIPQIAFARRIAKKFSPLEVYLLLLMIECFWARRQHHVTEAVRFDNFFNVGD